LKDGADEIVFGFLRWLVNGIRFGHCLQVPDRKKQYYVSFRVNLNFALYLPELILAQVIKDDFSTQYLE
jgi:hypothetical protein